MTGLDKHKQYDEEPVIFCSKCLSLKIKHEDSVGVDYCLDCGCTDVTESTIEDWEKMYVERYGHKYTAKSNDLKKSPIFNLSPHRLQEILSECPDCDEVVRTVYPKAPQGLSRVELVMWVFDKALTDGRMEDLKLVLVKYIRNLN